jgi:hypothetical protein
MANEEPTNCLKSNIIPCAAYFAKPSELKILGSHFFLSEQSKILRSKKSQIILLDGKILVDTLNQISLRVYHTDVVTEGSLLLVKSKEDDSYQLTQIEGDAKLETPTGAQSLLAGQFIIIRPNKLSVPRLASNQIKDWDLKGFGPEIRKLLGKIHFEKWIQAHDMSDIYRDVAASIEEQKERDLLARLEEKKRKEKLDQKYKDLFRIRHFNPQGWSEFLNDPDFSP